MNLEQTLHARWAATAALNDLLPSTRLMTGRYEAEVPTYPYGVLKVSSGEPYSHATDGSAMDMVLVQFVVVDDDYDDLKAIVEQVKLCYHRTDFALDGSDYVICMSRGTDSMMEHEETGVWVWLLNFRVRVHLPTVV